MNHFQNLHGSQKIKGKEKHFVTPPLSLLISCQDKQIIFYREEKKLKNLRQSCNSEEVHQHSLQWWKQNQGRRGAWNHGNALKLTHWSLAISIDFKVELLDRFSWDLTLLWNLHELNSFHLPVAFPCVIQHSVVNRNQGSFLFPGYHLIIMFYV